MQKVIITALILLNCNYLQAQTSIYQDTDNSGLNKKERIDNVEKYLTELSASVKKMEAKLDENDKKFKSFVEIVNVLKAKSEEAARTKLGEEKKVDKSSNPEIAKLQSELDSLKSKDIEKLKNEVQGLSDTLKAIQSTLKSQKL